MLARHTSSVIAMFGLVHEYLRSLRHDEVPDVKQRCGIVVIDEVDAHLHPVWQQKIVTLLRDWFPRVQFILTAHNPIVVAGCREDEVCVLRRNPTRGFSLVQFPNDFTGWQTEEIYRKVFEIENPDESFIRLDAMRPFKARLREKAAALASHGTRSADQERSLQALEEEILYIEKVEQARARRLTQEELERENRPVAAAAAEAKRRSDDLQRTLEAERQTTLRRIAALRLAIVAVTATATVVILALLGRLLG
jgi:hypothetical protein